MTNKINGIDVSECCFYNNSKCDNPNGMACNCINNAVCYFKELKRLQKENEELRQVRKNSPDIQEPYVYLYRQIKKQCHKLEEENKRLQMLSCANCGEKYLSPDGAELYEKNVQLKEENEELKKEKEKIEEDAEYFLNGDYCDEKCNSVKNELKYKQALEEIREILNKECGVISNAKVVGIINEALNDRD